MSKEVTFEELNIIKYNDLKAKFTELGIESAFTGGKKKEDLINDALDKLKKVKELKAQDMSDEEIKDELNKDDVIQAEEARLKAIEDAKDGLMTQKEAGHELKEKIIGMKLSPEQISSNIASIKANLKNNVTEVARRILLNKLVILESL